FKLAAALCASSHNVRCQSKMEVYIHKPCVFDNR
ncbi:MAG: hypothetical protein ACJAZF_004408, partial [Granulosicoccus sp.]